MVGLCVGWGEGVGLYLCGYVFIYRIVIRMSHKPVLRSDKVAKNKHQHVNTRYVHLVCGNMQTYMTLTHLEPQLNAANVAGTSAHNELFMKLDPDPYFS